MKREGEIVQVILARGEKERVSEGPVAAGLEDFLPYTLELLVMKESGELYFLLICFIYC